MKKLMILKYVGLILLLLSITFVSINTLAMQSEAMTVTFNTTGRAYMNIAPNGTVTSYGCRGENDSCKITMDFPVLWF